MQEVDIVENASEFEYLKNNYAFKINSEWKLKASDKQILFCTKLGWRATQSGKQDLHFLCKFHVVEHIQKLYLAG